MISLKEVLSDIELAEQLAADLSRHVHATWHGVQQCSTR